MQKTFATQPELFATATDMEHWITSHPVLHSLDDTEALLDWSSIEQILSSIYSFHTGRPSYSLLRLFRKFFHLALGGDVPEASTLGQFRTKLVEHDLWDRLLTEVEAICLVTQVKPVKNGIRVSVSAKKPPR